VKPLVTIYCDGACSPNPGNGGWGAILLSERHRARREISGAEPGTTNNRMELTAAIRALEALKRPCSVDVFTDSQYVQSAFAEGWLAKWQQNGWKNAGRKAVSNEDLWRRLVVLSTNHEIRWHWVRGHAENKENNRADELAVAARERLASEAGK
jgi:ribonuclease HI